MPFSPSLLVKEAPGVSLRMVVNYLSQGRAPANKISKIFNHYSTECILVNIKIYFNFSTLSWHRYLKPSSWTTWTCLKMSTSVLLMTQGASYWKREKETARWELAALIARSQGINIRDIICPPKYCLGTRVEFDLSFWLTVCAQVHFAYKLPRHCNFLCSSRNLDKKSRA